MNLIGKGSMPPVSCRLPAWIVLVILLSTLAAGCGGGGPESRKTGMAQTVEAEAAASGPMTRSLELTGTVEAARIARIASPAQGPVVECTVREGDRVEKGRVLIVIGRREAAEHRAEAAREKLARDEEDLEKIEKLVESGAFPGESLDEARLRVAESRARLSDALADIGDYSLTAPWDGEISRVFVTEGYFVSPREDLVEMYDPGSLVIRFAVPERDAVSVVAGTEIGVSLDAYGGRTFRAAIARLYPDLDRRTRTRTAEAVIEEEIEMVPGMFARLTVPVETVQDAVVVPTGAITVTARGKAAVFTVKGGKAFRRDVETGIEQGGLVEITSGVAAGDSVVVAGNQSLRDGAKVRVLKAGGRRD
jgi:RND family efflux transporter MFP subunit